MIRSTLRYNLMGNIPRGESPWGRAPTIRFGMAADAINVSDTCYMTVVQYYLANLGTTMESQVTSSVAPPIYVETSLRCNLSVVNSFSVPLCLAVCRASPSFLYQISLEELRDPSSLVAARLSRTRILAVTPSPRFRANQWPTSPLSRTERIMLRHPSPSPRFPRVQRRAHHPYRF